MRLYFVRHGESEANVKKEFSNTGLKHPLTAKGIEQAERVAKDLASVHFDRIYSSPLLRTLHTTQVITQTWGAQEFHVHDQLRECDVGAYEGRNDDTAWAEVAQMQDRWRDPANRGERIGGGENLFEIQTRFRGFIRDVVRARRHDDENILVVAHGGLFVVGLPSIFSNVNYAFACAHVIVNGQIIVASRQNGRLYCQSWGTIVKAPCHEENGHVGKNHR